MQNIFYTRTPYKKNVNFQDQHGRTVLMLACYHLMPDMAYRLLRMNSDITLDDNEENTFLLYTTLRHLGIIGNQGYKKADHFGDRFLHLLKEKGANFKAISAAGHTALWIAVQTHDLEMIDLLVKYAGQYVA